MGTKVRILNAFRKPSPCPDASHGYLDGIQDGHAYGWAWNPSNPYLRLSVDIIVNEAEQSTAIASMFRQDLKDKGFGDGKFGFRIKLPEDISTSEIRRISARISGTNIFLHGSPKFIPKSTCPAAKSKHGFMVLKDLCLQGWLTGREDAAVLDLTLYDYDNMKASSLSYKDNGQHKFSIRIPTTLLDGKPHVLALKITETGETIGQIAQILPFIQTPEDALKRWGGENIRAYLSPAAGLRYESLRRSIQSLAKELPRLSHDELREEFLQMAASHEQIIKGFSERERKLQEYPKLKFSDISTPDVSVVIPVHNKLDVTYNCLSSLKYVHSEISFEVIIVDDASVDDTLHLQKFVKGIKYIRQDESNGFLRSCNNGVRYARGKYIVLLNNDTEVTNGWLDELVTTFENNENVGLVGAKLLYPDGTLQEAGGIVWNTGDPWNYGRGGNAHDPRYNYVRDVDYVSGACLMLEREVWNRVKGFDELYVPAYFEDTDLAFKIRSIGKRVMYTPFAEVIHFEGQSNGTNISGGIKQYQEINRPKFKQKWSSYYVSNGTPGVDVDLEKDRNVTLRGLVIDTTTPSPDKDAGSYAAVMEMNLLRSLGCKLTFLPVNMAYLGEYTEALQRMGVECLHAPFYLSVNEVIEKRGREFDFVYITRYYVADEFIDKIRAVNPRAKILFNNADLHFLREIRYALNNPEDKKLMEDALNTRDVELEVMRKVDLVLSYNEAEHAVITSHNLGSTKIAKCPWVVKVKEEAVPFEKRWNIAFLGGFRHYPNIEGLQYFAREVMPLIRQIHLPAKLLVYGSHITEEIKSLAARDIIIKGWVPDVSEVYDNCRIFIAPLLSGAGIKGKVIGALAHGVPCVLTPIAAESTGIRNGLEARIVRKNIEWVTAIQELYEKKSVWEEYSSAAIKFALMEYSFENGKRLMTEAMYSAGLFSLSRESNYTN